MAVTLLSASTHQRWGRRVANLLLLLLVIYVALMAARFTWMALWTEQVVAPVYQGGDARGGQAVSTAPTRSLASYDFFGRPQLAEAVPQVIRQTAPETRLRLRLEGVFVAAQPEASGAIVAGTDGVTDYYRVGDIIAGNVELVAVEDHRILISRQGAVESLSFEDEELTLATATVSRPNDQDMTPEAADAFVTDATARLQAEGAVALAGFGLRPAGEGSGGYVFDGSNAMLRAVNLREGDVITSINGHSLGNIELDQQLIENWRNEAQLEVEVERAGARFTVTYAIPR